MKEFAAQTGGRYTYVDDIKNLQELALSFSSIFTDCDNFIISGCEVANSAITSGFIYLNGKVRHFAGASDVQSWPQYIYERNSVESVAYASGTDKVGRNVYSCSIAAIVPTSFDPLTNSVPASIAVNQVGALRLKDALFGKYALLLQAQGGAQTVKGDVSFTNDVSVSGALRVLSRLSIVQGTSNGSMYYEDGKLILQSQINDGVLHRMVVSDDGGFQLWAGNTVLADFNQSQIIFHRSVKAGAALLGNIQHVNNHIYNSLVASNDAGLSINVSGYQGGTSYYRNTHVGNGKGSVVLSVVGKTNTVQINGSVICTHPSPVGLVLQSSLAKSNMALQKSVCWHDANKYCIASIGYVSSATAIFSITNHIADVNILGKEAVDIGPAIKENGKLLSSKYASITTMTANLKKKADIASVYSTTQANQRFATLSGGLTQFVNSTKTKAVLRKEIDALSLGDMETYSPAKTSLLADMATTEVKKKQICKNIGAARPGDFQAVLKDSGWVRVTGNLYARQIGNIVCVQGSVRLAHDGDTVFTLPNSIDPPRYDVIFTAMDGSSGRWIGKIAGGAKKMIATDCNMHYITTPFSITYMT